MYLTLTKPFETLDFSVKHKCVSEMFCLGLDLYILVLQFSESDCTFGCILSVFQIFCISSHTCLVT